MQTSNPENNPVCPACGHISFAHLDKCLLGEAIKLLDHIADCGADDSRIRYRIDKFNERIKNGYKS